MPPNGKGRSGYRVVPEKARRARGYGAIAHYESVVIEWDSNRPGDLTSVEVKFPEPISQDMLLAVVAGLNNGSIPDRWS